MDYVRPIYLLMNAMIVFLGYSYTETMHARMFRSKCLRRQMSGLWWCDHDHPYESMHNCIRTKKVYIYEVLSLGGSYLGPSLWRHLRDKIWVPSLGGSCTMGPSQWRQLKLLGHSILEVVDQLSLSNLEARRSPCGSVLCDDGH